jgi:sucrose phosphorylase
MAVKNKVQLITYPDSLGGNLQMLDKVLSDHFSNIFQGGIHILPPFPSSGDRGFAPLTYLEIEPAFGTWEDIRQLSQKYDIMLDLMVNHISRQSEFFQDFLKHGDKSRYADLFMPLNKIWPDGNPSREDINKIFLRRNDPYSTYQIEETGEEVTVWTTFGKVTPSEQIDMDVNAPATRELFTRFMENFGKNNIKLIRLDAVGYVVKKPGTSCFFVEPEIYDFMDWIADLAKSNGIEILPEIHSQYETQFKLAERGFWIYDFILPYMVLDSLINRSSVKLLEYLKVRPHNQFTMLDCHDGVPIKPDLNDLVSTSDAKSLVDKMVERGSNLSRIFSPNHRDEDGFDVHQVRCSYYSVLNKKDDAYLAARAIQFFTPGIPQVYYVGLLAGENDVENVERTGEGREINRHNFTLEEIDLATQKPVVKRLLKLIEFRNEYPAFEGTFEVLDSQPDEVRLRWKNEQHICCLYINLKTNKPLIEYTDEENKTQYYEV